MGMKSQKFQISIVREITSPISPAGVNLTVMCFFLILSECNKNQKIHSFVTAVYQCTCSKGLVQKILIYECYLHIQSADLKVHNSLDAGKLLFNTSWLNCQEKPIKRVPRRLQHKLYMAFSHSLKHDPFTWGYVRPFFRQLKYNTAYEST